MNKKYVAIAQSIAVIVGSILFGIYTGSALVGFGAFCFGYALMPQTE